MLKMVHQLTLAGLALVLFGGLLSPVLAQAASTDAGGTETTGASGDTATTYKISSVEMPYISYITASGSQKHYWFPKLHLSYTSDEINNTDTLTQTFDAAYPNNRGAGNAKTMMGELADGVTLSSPQEKFGEYYFDFQKQPSISTPGFLSRYNSLVYACSWFIKLDAQLRLPTFDLNQAKTDYYQNALQQVKEATDNSDNEDYDPLKDAFMSVKALSNQLSFEVDPLCQQFGIDENNPDFAQKFSQVNPAETVSATDSLLNKPVRSLLTPSTDSDSYVTDGTLATVTEEPIMALYFGSAPSTSTATSQPVTIHYVDDQGNTLKPDKALSGALGRSRGHLPSRPTDH
ncbi:MucBP domain-containing protein [Levilactobacillus cerevisiae]|uniref:MucBP domain-containing protein n=1 Tax=Levilactobacillus cerevisiae TaxID=1704076 RepID=UPI000F79EBF8|nr:hypothetical protein [Levilactobacillus cerevisiae]